MAFSLDQVLIVMPAKDEEAVISSTITEVKRLLPEVSLLVINDGSSDATSGIALSSGAEVLNLPINLGVGGALRLGFRFAAAHNFQVMVQLDADGQHDPSRVLELVSLLDYADVVIGARFAGLGNYSVRGPRMWAMSILSRVLSGIVGTKLTDTTSGFKAHGPRAIQVFKDNFPAEYLGDTVEAIVIGHRNRLTFAQLPVEMRARVAGRPSHNALKSGVYLGRAMVALALALLRPQSR